MDSPRLLSLPTELLHYVCMFLPEKDLLSLFQTCLKVHNTLNTNLVWKRFVTEEARRLKNREQLLDPPLQLDPNLCEELQHVLRKNRLLSNWRNGVFSQHSSPHGVNVRILDVGNCYRENYLFTYNAVNNRCDTWDVRTDPKVHHTRVDEDIVDYESVIGDYSVFPRGCRVYVYDINLVEKTFPPLYSFSVNGEEIVKEMVEHPKGPCCVKWNCFMAENFLVYPERSSERSNVALHIWDIENARKFGTYLTPTWCVSVDHCILNNNCFIFRATDYAQATFLRLDITTKILSEATFKVQFSQMRPFYHKDHCIFINKDNEEDQESIKLEVYKFNLSEKLTERRFENVNLNLQHGEVIDGKLVIFTSECFLVINAVSLETVTVVPHGNVRSIMCETSLFGSIFLVTVGSDGILQIWDIEKKSFTLIPQLKFTKANISLNSSSLVHGKEPLTKFVIFEEKKVFVTNFW